MFQLTVCDALDLEHQVCRLFECDQQGVSGLVDADLFKRCPIEAAIMIVSYIYANKLQTSQTQYVDFFKKYRTIFDYPDENKAEHEVKKYIEELTEIVTDCLQRKPHAS